MIELGKRQLLEVVRQKEFGVYLSEKAGDETAVLLPKKQVPPGTCIGDKLEVFIYKDSQDRLIATVEDAKIRIGQTAVLKVKDVGKIGAFLDMGLEKELLLPFKEQTYRVRPGEECLVALYVDKSGRLAATMRVYAYMSNEPPYGKDDKVTGTIYEINPDIGAFVAVDNRYYGLIPARELYGDLREGDKVEARVTAVKPDGKLDLSIREKGYLQMETDAQTIMKVLEEYDGVLPFTDKASPEVIKREMSMSKNAFKRAAGHLLKEGCIEITEKSIRKL